MPVAGLPTLLALPLAIWSLLQTLNVIFTGGVGKNGSTVAVSIPFIGFNLFLHSCSA